MLHVGHKFQVCNGCEVEGFKYNCVMVPIYEQCSAFIILLLELFYVI